MLKYVLAWIPMVFIAIANGIFRESVISLYFTERTAHQLSTLSAGILIGLFIWIVLRIWKVHSAGQAIAVGLLWVVMTVTFEFLFGHYVIGHPFSRLFQDYNLLAGRVWGLFLLWVAVLPYLIYHWSRQGKNPNIQITKLK